MSVRLARPEDAQAVTGLIQEVYRGTYVLEAALDAAQVAHGIESGELAVALACDSDGLPVGTATLERTTPRTAVYGRAVVHGSQRGRGLFGALSQYLIQEVARDQGLAYVHSCVVTNHPYAQRQLHNLGLVGAGLLLGLYPEGMQMQGIGHAEHPVSSVQLVTAHDRAPRKVNLVDQDLRLAEQVLGQLRVPFTRGAEVCLTPARWVTSHAPAVGLVHFMLDGVGVPVSTLPLQESCLARLVWVDVPADSVTAPELVASLREAGFSLGGYLLGLGPDGGDVLRLQRYQGEHTLSAAELVMAPGYQHLVDVVFGDLQRAQPLCV